MLTSPSTTARARLERNSGSKEFKGTVTGAGRNRVKQTDSLEAGPSHGDRYGAGHEDKKDWSHVLVCRSKMRTPAAA